ncbi:MAG TPA: type II secretion system secretin GspD, partial [Candidatus Binatia bacterium]
YTIDPEVKGTVTINSAQPLSTDDLLPIFHQILRMNGAIAVKSGNLYRITTIKDGKVLARPFGQTKEDSFALQILPVRFFSVAEMKKVLTPFLQPGAELIENPRGNFLIIMDLPSNIQRLMEIADLIDVQVFAGTRMELYQPKVASAEELAQEMTKVMQSFASSAPQTDNFTAEFIPLPRINQLLVISHSEAAWTYAKRWLDRIDVAAEGPGRRIFIYPVENGKAAELADVLNQALGQPSTGARPSQTLLDLHRSTMTSGMGQTGGQPGSPFGARSPTTSSSFGPSGIGGGYAAVAAPGQPVPAPTPTPVAPGVVPPRPPAPAAQQQAKPEEQLRIVADSVTNSLIIYGTVQEFQNIKNILKDLDIVPRQVLLDVVIAEVGLTDDQAFGIEYQIMNGVTSIFGQQFGSTGAINNGLTPFTATGGTAQFPVGISGIIGRTSAIKAFITALQKDSRLKILSSPSILASDNRPARIQVGSEDPVATGSTTTQVGTAASSTSIQYRNTGRIVTVIPQVNSQGLVNLQLLMEVSSPGPPVQVGPDSYLSYLTRQAETSAVVQDGDTLVIGGMIGEQKNRERHGVPYLMDLPYIGRFFASTTDHSDRTELIMMITPHVISGRDRARQVTDDFKNSLSTLRNELDRMAREKEQLMRSAPPAQPQPAAPGPSGDQPPVPNVPAPAPAPSAATTGPKASSAPPTTIILGPQGSPIAADADKLPFRPMGTLREAYEANPRQQEPSDAAAQNDRTRAQPAMLALAVKVGREPPAKVLPNSSLAGSKPGPVWMVQVAAFAQKKDAEALATNLRALGYDAFTQEAEVEAKLWHRVRVGKTLNQKDAFELRKALKANNKFEQAFVTR